MSLQHEQQTVHSRIDSNATHSPDACALRHGGVSLSYGELNARANHLAKDILTWVPARSVVAVWMDRSFGHIIAALAAFKAGCAYVWLEPSDPAERVRALIEHHTIGLVLTDPIHVAALSDIRIPVVAVEPDALSSIAVAPYDVAGGDDIAYVAFTSGTTGRPKGAMITHANLAALIDWHNEAFAVTPDDRASHLAGLSFDASEWEVWPYLVAGACIVLADDTTRTSPDLLADWLVRERITIAFVPTALAAHMITSDWPAGGTLRTLLTGGETLRTSPRAGLPFAVYNNYGVAECTVVSTFGLLTPDLAATGKYPSIGTPVRHAAIHLLDDDGKPVRHGEEGEIWIGGSGVGLGYLDEPELTTAAFVDNPSHDGSRLYRTGDRGRLRPDGEIMHLGRRDDQCKIRGVRIETEEVAAALRRHAEVADVVVVVEEDVALGSHLVAYVVPAKTTRPASADLRAFLMLMLPVSYVPARFVSLASLPLTPNGKIDRSALAAAARSPEVAPKILVEPTGPIEVNLLKIVQETLRMTEVSTDDDFFLLGGHSLLATQVVLRARETFGIELSLRDLFAAPTVETLGALVSERIEARVAMMSEDQIHAMLLDARA